MSHDQVTPRPRIGRILLAFDVLLPLALVAGAFLVHDTAYVLRAPYWNDEAWVAVSTKAPLSTLTTVTGPSPLGWTFLLRLAVVGGEQRARLVPLLFAGLTAAAAYWLGRELRFGRLAALAMGIVALFVPAMLVRDDLKQYTAEAFVAVVVATLLVRAHRERSRRTLVGLVVGCLLGVTIANATLFVGSAALLGLAVSAGVARAWRRLLDVVVAGATTGLLWAVWVRLVVVPRDNPQLKAFWNSYYPPRTLSGLRHYLALRLQLLAGPFAGMHDGTLLGLAVLGSVVVLAATRDLPLALLPVFAFGEQVAAGEARLFPVLDERTSTWLLVLIPLLAFAALGRVFSLPWLPDRWPIVPIFGGLLAVALAGRYAYEARADVRVHPIPYENTRSQTAIVLAERRPGDVIVVDTGADYSYAYYGGVHTEHTVPTTLNALYYFVDYSSDPDVVPMHQRTSAAVVTAYQDALRRAALTPGARIWLVRAHMSPTELEGWQIVLKGAHIVQQTSDGLVEVQPTS